MEDLGQQIEEKRIKLNNLVMSENLVNENVIQLSQELDMLIYKYYDDILSSKKEAACSQFIR